VVGGAREWWLMQRRPERRNGGRTGIRLCPNCNADFNDIQCPGFIFFPGNLRFCIDFENNDFEEFLERSRL